MNTSPRRASALLSVMMFLQYAVWGIWLPYLANYLTAPIESGGLGFSGGQVGWILGLAASIGAVTAPFLSGQIADRFMDAEKYLALLLIAGGAVKYATAFAETYETFLTLSIIYSVLYMPTLALTNSIAFAHLRNPEKQFPLVRVWGTIGWIVASNLFPLLWLQTNLDLTWIPPFLSGDERPDATARIVDCLRWSGMIAVAYGVYAWVLLPRTPPARAAEHPLAFARAFEMLRHPGFMVVTLVALPIAMIHQVYFIRTGPFLRSVGFSEAHVGPVMSIGQFAEIAMLAVLGWVIAALGYRWTLVLGCLAYAARFAIFAVATEQTKELVAAAMVLHGLCYGCFFAGAYIYVERVSPPDIRHSAQAVFGIVILGVGPVMAGFWNERFDRFKVIVEGAAEPVQSYSEFWWAQAAVGLLSGIVLALAFRPNGQRADERDIGRGEADSAEVPL